MRDLLIIAIVLAGSIAALRRPWIGVLVWTWLSIMNPHRYSWGMAYDAPLAAISAASILIGLFITRDRTSPFKGSAAVWLAVFMAWITLSWQMGIDPDNDYWQWNKVMKIDLMILVALALFHSRQQIMLLMWVSVGSLALLGIKGGIFTIINGGNFRVWGPPDSFIADNNEFALAMVMTVPLLRFLHMQVTHKWLKRGLLLSMLLCAASAFGSHSRGALLAIAAMTLYLWMRSSQKLTSGIIVVVAALGLLSLMPAEWTERMNTIQTYEEDASAMGRIHAWTVAYKVALDRPTGVGFQAARPELFARYAPASGSTHAAHSIYFQVLGNHGYPGLLIFLAIWIATWRTASQLIKGSSGIPEAQWCRDLGAMAQVALIAFAVGGAFLSLAYFDLPYVLMVIVLSARVWLAQRGWLSEPSSKSRWQELLGVTPGTSKAAAA